MPAVSTLSLQHIYHSNNSGAANNGTFKWTVRNEICIWLSVGGGHWNGSSNEEWHIVDFIQNAFLFQFSMRLIVNVSDPPSGRLVTAGGGVWTHGPVCARAADRAQPPRPSPPSPRPLPARGSCGVTGDTWGHRGHWDTLTFRVHPLQTGGRVAAVLADT